MKDQLADDTHALLAPLYAEYRLLGERIANLTSQLDLISMADIARLTGQRRATVGNWKARHTDFPPARGHSARGPLYDPGEVTAWLVSTNRLYKPPQGVWSTHVVIQEPVAVSDIADRCGVKPNAVSNWITRHPDFPSPKVVVARGEIAIYDWPDVRRWAAAHRKTVIAKT